MITFHTDELSFEHFFHLNYTFLIISQRYAVIPLYAFIHVIYFKSHLFNIKNT